MRFVNGSQGRGSISLAVILLCSAAFVLPGATLSVAQESSGQVGYFTRSFPAEPALAKIEADGHSLSEARQLLQARLPKGQGRSNDASSPEIVPFARLQKDQIEVQGSVEYIDSVHQRLLDIEEFGLKQLLYTVLVVEVPTDKATAIIDKWDSVGRCVRVRQKANAGNLLANAIAPASLTTSTTTSEFRISSGLSETQINEIVGFGKVVQSPEIVGEKGVEVTVRVGRDVPFVGTYEPVKDENGNDTATLQPVLGTIHDGLTLGLVGSFDDRKEIVRLEVRLTDTKFNGMGEPFTFETENGPLTVQQPEVASSGVQTHCNVSTNETIALCGSPNIRASVVKCGVPLIGRIPYLGNIFKYNSKANQSITTIFLVRCQELSGGRLPH